MECTGHCCVLEHLHGREHSTFRIYFLVWKVSTIVGERYQSLIVFMAEEAFRTPLITQSSIHLVSLVHSCCQRLILTLLAGPGGSTSARVAEDHILTSEQASSFTLEEVFDGIPAWIDFNYQY
jgi:hypothetical protein